MSWSVKEVCECRLCGSSNIEVVLDLGATPPANAFLTQSEATYEQPKYPLRAFLCHGCGSVQLKDTVNPEVLFKNYFYESSTSAAFRKHFEDYAKHVSEYCGLKLGDVVLDVGSNDNILLKPFKALGLFPVGVEPATNIVEKHKGDGIPVINEFFTPEIGAILLDGYGPIKLVTCNNCFAHLSDWNPFMRALRTVLADDGWFVFENAYLLDTIKNSDVGQFYHEHTAYHSIKPLQKFFRNWGMNIVHVERNNIQCGSIRVFVKKVNNSEYVDFESVQELIKLEEDAGLYSVEQYKDFAKRINENGDSLRELLVKLKANHQKICGFAWPAKATTLTSLYDIGYFLNFIVEDAAAKQGKWTPVFNLPIFDKSKLEDADYAVILAYNFNDVIIKNNPQFKGKWIKILPTLEVI